MPALTLFGVNEVLNTAATFIVEVNGTVEVCSTMAVVAVCAEVLV